MRISKSKIANIGWQIIVELFIWYVRFNVLSWHVFETMNVRFLNNEIIN